MDYLDRSKIGAMQIRWHLDSSFSCMNYRSDDGKTSVSVGFYSCLGRLQSLSSTCLAWNLLETCRIPVLNVSLDAQSEALTFSGSLWEETPLGKRSSNLFMLGVFGYSERATSSWVFQKQFWRCWLNFGRKVTSRLSFAKFLVGNSGLPDMAVLWNLEWLWFLHESCLDCTFARVMPRMYFCTSHASNVLLHALCLECTFARIMPRLCFSQTKRSCVLTSMVFGPAKSWNRSRN